MAQIPNVIGEGQSLIRLIAHITYFAHIFKHIEPFEALQHHIPFVK